MGLKESQPVQTRLRAMKAQFKRLLKEAQQRERESPLDSLKLSEKATEMARQMREPCYYADALLARSNAKAKLSNHHDALRDATESIKIYEQEKDQFGEMSALRACADLYRNLGDFDLGVQFADRAVAQARRLKEKEQEAAALISRGILFIRLGDYTRTMRDLYDALALAKKIKNTRRQAEAEMCISISLKNLGDYHAALEMQLGCVKKFAMLGDASSEAGALTNSGMIYFLMNDFDNAAHLLEKGAILFKKIGQKLGLANALSNLMGVYIGREKFDDALRLGDEALTLQQDIQNKLGEGTILHRLGAIHFRKKQHERAHHYFNAARQIFETFSNTESLAYSLIEDAAVYLSESDMLTGKEKTAAIETAVKQIKQAIEIASKSGLKAVERDAQLSLAKAYKTAQHFEDAVIHFERFYDLDEYVFSEDSDRRRRNAEMLFKVHESERLAAEARRKSVELETNLNLKNQQLAAMAIRMSEQKELIARLKKELTQVAQKQTADVNHLAAIIERKLNASKDWEKFEHDFETANRGFMQTLAKRFPTLSPMELKICALIKLNLPTKDIARLLAISPRTVEVHRRNARRKMRLRSKTNLTNFLMESY